MNEMYIFLEQHKYKSSAQKKIDRTLVGLENQDFQNSLLCNATRTHKNRISELWQLTNLQSIYSRQNNRIPVRTVRFVAF